MSVSVEVSAKKISGKVLQRLRSGRGLVQEEMADRLGKARSSLAGWEVGRGGLNLENLVSFLDELGVSMEEFGRQFDLLRSEADGRERPARGTPAQRESSRGEPGRGTERAPVVLQASQALVMVFPEGAEAEEAQRQGDALRPWVHDLFKRAERMFPGPEEVAEPDSPVGAADRHADRQASAGSKR